MRLFEKWLHSCRQMATGKTALTSIKGDLPEANCQKPIIFRQPILLKVFHHHLFIFKIKQNEKYYFMHAPFDRLAFNAGNRGKGLPFGVC